MDIRTQQFLETLIPNPNPIAKITSIYEQFKRFDSIDLSLTNIEEIFNAVVTEFYPGLINYITSLGKKENIIFVNKPGDSLTIDAFLELSAYDPGDPEFLHYDFGIVIALDYLNTLNIDFMKINNNIFYSGGYLTKSRIIFIILMLLHEIIHLIEYTDPYLSTATNEHTVFFYKVGFEVFGLISRLSEITKLTELNTDKDLLELRLKALESMRLPLQKKRKRANDKTKHIYSVLDDGASYLNDYSHYPDGNGNALLIGYIPKDSSMQFSIGGKSKYYKKYKKYKKYTKKNNIKKYNKNNNKTKRYIY